MMDALPESIRDFGWYGAGYAVYCGGRSDPDYYPPLNDMEAQEEWLQGFVCAWSEIVSGAQDSAEPLGISLAQILEDRPELLMQILAQYRIQDSPTWH